MSLLHCALKVAIAHAELDGNIAFVVFSINNERAGLGFDRRHLFQRDPRAIRRIHQDIADRFGIPPKLGQKADHQIEESLTLEDLGHPLTSHRRLYDCIDVRDPKPIAGAGLPIHLDQQIGLSDQPEDT